MSRGCPPIQAGTGVASARQHESAGRPYARHKAVRYRRSCRPQRLTGRSALASGDRRQWASSRPSSQKRKGRRGPHKSAVSRSQATHGFHVLSRTQSQSAFATECRFHGVTQQPARSGDASPALRQYLVAGGPDVEHLRPNLQPHAAARLTRVGDRRRRRHRTWTAPRAKQFGIHAAPRAGGAR